MDAFIYSVVAALIVSLISLIGIFTAFLNEKVLSSITKALIAVAAGGLLGGAFFHLIPEVIFEGSKDLIPLIVFGFFLFFVLEKMLYWRHCHDEKCEVHSFTYLSLVGDSIHNFADGLIIAASFLVDFSVGVTSTLAVMLHEIPQEIGDFAVLVYGGFSRVKALLYNFLTALIVILGAIIGYFVGEAISGILPIILAMAAGSFIYVGASDLIPELHNEQNIKASILYMVLFFIGLAIMWGFGFIVAE